MHISKQIRETDAHLETDKAVLYVTANNQTLEIKHIQLHKKKKEGGIRLHRAKSQKGYACPRPYGAGEQAKWGFVRPEQCYIVVQGSA